MVGMMAYVRDRSEVTAQDKSVPNALFLADKSQIGLRISSSKLPEEPSDSSSSIGESSENEEEEEEKEDDAVSCQGGALDSLSSCLQDSLPIKRGLSNYYSGKSKSFGNLMEASNNAKNLEKVENPFNKRRRLLIANKLRRKGRSLTASNLYSWQNPNSMPLLAIQEPNEESHKDENDDQTQSCFCLSSLQEDR